jgi:hypothetical protein
MHLVTNQTYLECQPMCDFSKQTGNVTSNNNIIGSGIQHVWDFIQ